MIGEGQVPHKDHIGTKYNVTVKNWIAFEFTCERRSTSFQYFTTLHVKLFHCLCVMEQPKNDPFYPDLLDVTSRCFLLYKILCVRAMPFPSHQFSRDI